MPTVPAPQPTATPTPASEPEPDPYPYDPGDGGGGGGGGNVSGTCGQPLPPPIARVNVQLHGGSSSRALLDSTPLVSDATYCRSIGFTDGRSVCPVRMEGDPERAACEALRVGRASDTGRAGPTWSANGKSCNGPDGGTSCLNHSDNQFLVWAYGSGTFRACTAGGVCGELRIP